MPGGAGTDQIVSSPIPTVRSCKTSPRAPASDHHPPRLHLGVEKYAARARLNSTRPGSRLRVQVARESVEIVDEETANEPPRSRWTAGSTKAREGESDAGGNHRRAARLHGLDDLVGVDPL